MLCVGVRAHARAARRMQARQHGGDGVRLEAHGALGVAPCGQLAHRAREAQRALAVGEAGVAIGRDELGLEHLVEGGREGEAGLPRHRRVEGAGEAEEDAR